jgi:hypothetical protein
LPQDRYPASARELFIRIIPNAQYAKKKTRLMASLGVVNGIALKALLLY